MHAQVRGVVDRLVRDMLAVIGIHAPQCAGNLLGRPAPQEQIADHMPERPVRMKFGQRPGGSAARDTGGLPGLGGVAAGAAVASQFTADGAGVAPEQSGDGPLAQVLLQEGCDGDAVLGLQL